MVTGPRAPRFLEKALAVPVPIVSSPSCSSTCSMSQYITVSRILPCSLKAKHMQSSRTAMTLSACTHKESLTPAEHAARRASRMWPREQQARRDGHERSLQADTDRGCHVMTGCPSTVFCTRFSVWKVPNTCIFVFPPSHALQQAAAQAASKQASRGGTERVPGPRYRSSSARCLTSPAPSRQKSASFFAVACPSPPCQRVIRRALAGAPLGGPLTVFSLSVWFL